VNLLNVTATDPGFDQLATGQLRLYGAQMAATSVPQDVTGRMKSVNRMARSGLRNQ
jgi:hypothetical protein